MILYILNNLSIYLFFLSLSSLVHSQSDSKLTESGQVNRLIFDSVARSPAFISRGQFVEAWSAAVPYLSKPENVTHLDVFQYPFFMNSAVMVGKINNTTQLAMYFAQVLYETNGLTIRNIAPCSKLFGSRESCDEYVKAKVNNTGGYCDCVDYHGRGNLFIQDASTYKEASQDLFGSDILFKNPNHVATHPQVAWYTAAWNWYNKVGSLVGTSDAFGLSTKFLRPDDCKKDGKEQSEEAIRAFNIYQQVLAVFDSDRQANSSGCINK